VGFGGEVEGDADASADGGAVARRGAEAPATDGVEGGRVEGLAAGDGDGGGADGAVALDGDEDFDGGVDALGEFVRGVFGVDVFDDGGRSDARGGRLGFCLRGFLVVWGERVGSLGREGREQRETRDRGFCRARRGELQPILRGAGSLPGSGGERNRGGGFFFHGDVLGGGVYPPRAMDRSISVFYRIFLVDPELVLWHLDELYARGRIDSKPNLWQMSMGIFYMFHRLMFRSETVGVDDAPVRGTWRARLFRHRLARFPFLVWEKAIDPLDFTGLAGRPERKLPHLLGAYHPGENAIYDLECLSWNDEALRKLRTLVAEVVEGKSRRAEFLRDLTVYEGYHERLLGLVDRALAGDYSPREGEEDHPDRTLRGFIRWCAAQPETPEETFSAFLRGQIRFGPAEAG